MEHPPHVRLVRSDQLGEHARYADAALALGAGLVFTAGACPLDQAGEIVGVEDFAAQAEQVMTNLRIALRAIGADLPDVVKTTIYVATSSREDLVTVWEIVSRHFDDHEAPSTLLGVSVLGYRDQLVEVEAVAALA
jgi:enamine deaminase RidA (YjgF/YER057c/UK114 family)